MGTSGGNSANELLTVHEVQVSTLGTFIVGYKQAATNRLVPGPGPWVVIEADLITKSIRLRASH